MKVYYEMNALETGLSSVDSFRHFIKGNQKSLAAAEERIFIEITSSSEDFTR
ncbi:MAG: hypothetical protein IPG99_15885 [Ignavibacteria bacterium]|nr:hypothetical protein [Ignavibacteria bacterium]